MDKLVNDLMTKLDEFLAKPKEEFKLADLFPKLDDIWDTVALLTRIFVMAGPLILLGLGLWYFFAPPKEANHRAGFRTFWGMGSVEAWRITQRIAGAAFGIVGFTLTVVMATICNGYSAMDPVEALQSAGRCILWQIGVTVVICLICHLIPLILFDRKGNSRFRK